MWLKHSYCKSPNLCRHHNSPSCLPPHLVACSAPPPARLLRRISLCLPLPPDSVLMSPMRALILSHSGSVMCSLMLNGSAGLTVFSLSSVFLCNSLHFILYHHVIHPVSLAPTLTFSLGFYHVSILVPLLCPFPLIPISIFLSFYLNSFFVVFFSHFLAPIHPFSSSSSI